MTAMSDADDVMAAFSGWRAFKTDIDGLWIYDGEIAAYYKVNGRIGDGNGVMFNGARISSWTIEEVLSGDAGDWHEVDVPKWFDGHHYR